MKLRDLFTAPEPTPEPEKPPEPQYVTQAQLDASQDKLFARLDRLAEVFRPQVQTQVVEPARQAAPSVSTADIDEALRSGEGAADKLSALVNERVGAAVNTLRSREVEPLRKVGLGAMEQMAKGQFMANLPKEHKRFLPEIEAGMQMIPEENRVDPKAWEGVYKTVVGYHHEELVNEVREQALREAGSRQPESTPTNREVEVGQGRRMRVPSVEEFAGEEGMAALKERGKGMDPDAWARAAGYESWPDYCAMAAQFEEEIEEYPNVPLGSKTRGVKRYAGN